jgi:hypothetical protein
MLRIDASVLDYTIIALYFATVIGIGFAARRRPNASRSRAATASGGATRACWAASRSPSSWS